VNRICSQRLAAPKEGTPGSRGDEALGRAGMDGIGGLEHFPDEVLRLAVRVGQELRQKRYRERIGSERAAQPQPSSMKASYRGPTGSGQATVESNPAVGSKARWSERLGLSGGSAAFFAAVEAGDLRLCELGCRRTRNYDARFATIVEVHGKTRRATKSEGRAQARRLPSFCNPQGGTWRGVAALRDEHISRDPESRGLSHA
jgi:hypothetical protein